MERTPAPPLPFAHPADAVRAYQKDEQCRGLLRQRVCEALEEVAGHRRASRWQPGAALLADAAYTAALLAGGPGLSGRTLGEEYCELLPVTTPGLQRPTAARRLAATALALLPVVLLRRLAALGAGPSPRPAPGPAGAYRLRCLRWRLRRLLVAAGEAAPPILRLHLATFYLFGAFRHISDRCLGLRALSIAERPDKGCSYRLLGALLLLQLMGQACGRCLEWQRARGGGAGAAEEPEPAAAAAAAPAGRPTGSPTSSPTGSPLGPGGGRTGAGRQPTCHICMCSADCTTATPCGHLFCWDCIAGWCAMKASCPLCRAPALPQELLPLGHYEVPSVEAGGPG